MKRRRRSAGSETGNRSPHTPYASGADNEGAGSDPRLVRQRQRCNSLVHQTRNAVGFFERGACLKLKSEEPIEILNSFARWLSCEPKRSPRRLFDGEPIGSAFGCHREVVAACRGPVLIFSRKAISRLRIPSSCWVTSRWFRRSVLAPDSICAISQRRRPSSSACRLMFKTL
jgi:hypothetical protein